MEERLDENLIDTARLEIDPAERTIHDLLTPTEIAALLSETLGRKNEENIPASVNMSPEEFLAKKIAHLRWEKQFNIPSIKEEPLSKASERAYQLWDQQQAKALLKKQAEAEQELAETMPNPSEFDEVETVPPHKPIWSSQNPLEVGLSAAKTDLERQKFLLSRAENKMADLKNRPGGIRPAKKDMIHDLATYIQELREKVKTLSEEEATTRSKRADLLEMMTVMGVPKSKEDPVDQYFHKEETAELVREAYKIPEPEPVPEKVGLFGRFKKWLATDDSRPKADITRDFLNQPVPKPTLRPIANPAYRGIPINRENN